MALLRLTIISNSKQTQKATLLLPPNSQRNAILKAAKDKLRLKKPTRIFLPGGDELTTDTFEIRDGSEFLVSCGEEYIGLRKTSSVPNHNCVVRVIAKSSYIDPISSTQLHSTATLPGMVQAVGMPDLHPGTKSPVGAAFVSRGFIHPPLIGGDIGCGMAVYRTNLQTKDVSDDQVKRIADRLVGIEGPWEGDVVKFLAQYLSADEIKETSSWETSLGTIGAGNHFAELQQITESLSKFAMDDIVLVVHSGSRGLGQEILKQAKETYPAESPEAEEYLRRHHIACRWAKANRDLIALRFLSRISRQNLSLSDVSRQKILDIWHNSVEPMGDTYIHRKGAAPATTDLVIIPGSRGSLSAFVEPIPTSETAYSLAHGAGRAQSRAAALRKLSQRYRPEDLQRTKLGGWVICEDKELIFEEAPEAYKEVENVVADLVDAGACKIVAWGMPRVSYKIRKC